MAAFLFSILFVVYAIFYPPSAIANPTLQAGVMAITAALLFITFPLLLAFSWSPLRKAEQGITPRILEMFKKDLHVTIAMAWFSLFPIATIFLLTLVLSPEISNKNYLFLGWILLAAISIDFLMHFSKRILKYLNPAASIALFSEKALECVRDEKEVDLFSWLDGLSEIAIKAIQNGGTSLANESLNEQQKIARTFLISSKSIGHHQQDSQTAALGITDKVSYTMYYIYQRFEMVFDRALEKKLEPTCSYLLTLLGKICLDAAKLDITLASSPLRYLGKLIKKADEEGLEDVVLKGTCTLSEVAKGIINETDISYSELQEPFFSIIHSLEETAKSEFRRNKEINFKILTQPLVDLKELFQEGKAASHQDAPVIIQDINRVLAEFDALEVVLKTIPSIPVETPPQSFEKTQG